MALYLHVGNEVKRDEVVNIFPLQANTQGQRLYWLSGETDTLKANFTLSEDFSRKTICNIYKIL